MRLINTGSETRVADFDQLFQINCCPACRAKILSYEHIAPRNQCREGRA
jgi:hypothetical protein